MDNKDVWEILEKIKDLPTLPTIYFKVNKLLQDNEASIENVARVIEIDSHDYVFEDNVEKAIKPLLVNSGSWLPRAMTEIDMAYEFFLEEK